MCTFAGIFDTFKKNYSSFELKILAKHILQNRFVIATPESSLCLYYEEDTVYMRIVS